jgi:hypothetical protein
MDRADQSLVFDIASVASGDEIRLLSKSEAQSDDGKFDAQIIGSSLRVFGADQAAT